MLRIQVERFGDVAVIHCEGRIVCEEAAFELRDSVRNQRNSRAILLDLSDIQALEGGGLGMLLSLQKWTHDRGIIFQVFDPPERVRHSLERLRHTAAVEIASMNQVLSLLRDADELMPAELSKPRALSHAA